MTRYFLFNITLLIAFSFFAFSHNPGRLFIGNDGPMAIALLQQQLEFFGATTRLHSNFLQGIGNVSFPLNFTLLPGFRLPLLDEAGHFTPAASYTWFACLMFATMLLVGWNYGFPRGVTYGAAWLVTLLMFPYFEGYFAIYAVTASAPVFIVHMFAAALADTGIRRIGNTWRATIFYALLILAAILLMLVVTPASIIILLPFLTISFIVSLAGSTRAVRWRKLGAAAAVITICLLLGWVEYVAGLLLYSSSGFFMTELADSYAASREFASILFQGHLPDRAFGPALFILALLGAWQALRRFPDLRAGAVITLTGQALHAGVAAQLLALSGGWAGPPPIYSEMLFFAFYGLFAVHFLARILHRYVTLRMAYALPPIGVALLVAVLLVRPAMTERDLLNSYAMPPASTPVTDLLEKNIGLRDGSVFRGRVASVLPFDITRQANYSVRVNMASGNDHHTTGLWLKHIPTLIEYNQLITPATYQLTRTFLVQPDERQNRSWASISQLNPLILRMLGVSYVLTTLPQEATPLGSIESRNRSALSLYALEGANTQGMAAHDVWYTGSLQEALTRMQSPEFNLHVAVIAGPQAQVHYAPIDSSAISIESGAWRIRARSAGKSLLIVPIEYSRCMDITVLSGEKPDAMRVNIALTGLVFEHGMDILLATSTGPFHHPRCRLGDYSDFKAIWKER